MSLVEHPCPADVPPSDAELLRRFIERHDRQAAEELIRRHGQLVMDVCRRILGRSADADDAFQATFLVLLRGGLRLREPRSLAAWLYGTAWRIAVRLRTKLARQQSMEAGMEPHATENPFEQVAARHDLEVFDAELARLPERYRASLVLHYLEGRSQREIAQTLGATEAAVEGLLKRGRTELRARLARRGVVLTTTLAAVAVQDGLVSAADWSPLVESTIQAATVQSPQAWENASNAPRAETLFQQELKIMWLQKVSLGGSLAAGSVLAVLLLGWSLLGSTLAVGAAEGPADDSRLSSETVLATDQEPMAVAVESPKSDATVAAPQRDAIGAGATTARLDQKTVDELMQSPINFAFRFTKWLDAFLILRHKVPVELDMKLVHDAGVDLDRPLDLNLGEMSRGTAFRILLQPYGLEVKLIDGRLKIVRTADAASSALSRNAATAAGGETQSRGAAAGSQSVPKWQTRSSPARIAVARILRALDEQTDADFNEMPLKEGIAFFSALHDIPMQFDTKALAEAGLSLETPITMERNQLSLESALRQLGDSYGFDFVIQYEALLITTPERAAALKETRVYDLRAFPEKVVEALAANQQLQVVAATSAEDGVHLLLATGNQRSLREFEEVIDRVWRTLHSGE